MCRGGGDKGLSLGPPRESDAAWKRWQERPAGSTAAPQKRACRSASRQQRCEDQGRASARAGTRVTRSTSKSSEVAQHPDNTGPGRDVYIHARHLHLECRSHRAEERMSHSLMVPLLLL